MKNGKLLIFAAAFGLLIMTYTQGCSTNKSSTPEENSSLGNTSSSWASFTKSAGVAVNPQYHVAGDPSVIRWQSGYLMYYACIDKSNDHLTICVTQSSDGNSWSKPNTGGTVDGRVLPANPSWSNALETPYAAVINGFIYLYFAGYNWKANVPLNYPSYFGLAGSANGLDFYYPANSPILGPTANALDNDALYSPSMVLHQGVYYMIYSGFCFSSAQCPSGKPAAILGATSSDGVSFTKASAPVLQARADISWMNKSVAEAEIVKGPDNQFYLFFTGIDLNDKQAIGVAVSASPLGPWTINPNPIIAPGNAGSADESGTVAPSVLIENNQVRVWYSGFSKDGYIRILSATAPWPLKTGF